MVTLLSLLGRCIPVPAAITAILVAPAPALPVPFVATSGGSAVWAQPGLLRSDLSCGDVGVQWAQARGAPRSRNNSSGPLVLGGGWPH